VVQKEKGGGNHIEMMRDRSSLYALDCGQNEIWIDVEMLELP
jgi:hypothetical protein